MLETYKYLFLDVARNFFRNVKTSPLLYLFFCFMMFFSVAGMVFITLFLIRQKVEVNIYEVFLIILFMVTMKSGVDFHKYYIKSNTISYPLSAPVTHARTISEIFLVVFWLQLGLWAFFSILFSILIALSGVRLAYPIEYLQFTMGVILGTILGSLIAMHFFSSKRLRLIPIPVFFLLLWFYREPTETLIILLLATVYLIISFKSALDSYQFVKRIERKKELDQVKIRDTIKAIFHKETTLLWRDRLLFSFIFSAVTIGFFSGYLAQFGGDSILPEGIKQLARFITPSMYGFLGVYILAIYTSVFTSLNFFLAEEDTEWLIRNLPIREKTIMRGKAVSLILPFICSIPFVAFFSAFKGLDMIPSMTWFLTFSFLVGVTISFPLGAKYMGKKSDVLLLYCVAMILFIVLALAMAFENLISLYSNFLLPFYIITILAAFVSMFLSIEFSTHIFKLRYNASKTY
ncbi:MAG: hypothetical protein QHH19_05565 [Candidatus Thermoplasmatota archaeon]|nr:hypothetical protein [Candidatus Thermoplasmatota archaeon]